MVKHAASMQSLNSSMSNARLSSPPSTETPPLETLSKRHSMQLRGADNYTKTLMNKVATGEATDAELAAFNEHVQKIQADRDVQPAVNSNVFTATSNLAPTLPPSVGHANTHAQQDFELQLMLLEQQNKKRLQMARMEQARMQQQCRDTEMSNVKDDPQDYNSQLLMLEQHNKKRLQMARMEQARMGPQSRDAEMSEVKEDPHPQTMGVQSPQLYAPVAPMPGMTFNNQPIGQHMSQAPRVPGQDIHQHLPWETPSNAQPQIFNHAETPAVSKGKFSAMLDKRRMFLAEKEKKDLAYGVPGSTWERDHNSILYKSQAECTAEENAQVEMMWKQHLQSRKEHRTRSMGTEQPRQGSKEPVRYTQATRDNAEKYCQPLCEFLSDNPTVFHAVDAMKKQLEAAGFTELSERDSWDIKRSGSYFVRRNGSSIIAFTVGEKYESGNGCAILAGHVDALTAKLKPISEVSNKAGYVQLGVAPYGGALNSTWWDRDLGIGGRVLVKEDNKIVEKLVKLDWPIARIPTLAPHFGAAAAGPFNKETQMVPIIGLEGLDSRDGLAQTSEPFSQPPVLGGEHGPVGSFVSTQPVALVKAISAALGMTHYKGSVIVNWELELFDVQKATVGGLNKEFIFAGRIDDKLCSWAAMQALIESKAQNTSSSSQIKVVACFDDEEIGSGLRQGARSNFLPQTIERAVHALADKPTPDLTGRTYANSFLLSSDVTHAVNPNFLGAYLENHAPHLNVGLTVAADSNGHMTTDAVSTSILQRCADKVGAKLQVFQIRNDSRSGGTVGPMLSSMTGIRAIDAGIPQLSMHSIRATTGSLDPGLGVLTFKGFLDGFEEVDKEFRT